MTITDIRIMATHTVAEGIYTHIVADTTEDVEDTFTAAADTEDTLEVEGEEEAEDGKCNF